MYSALILILIDNLYLSYIFYIDSYYLKVVLQ